MSTLITKDRLDSIESLVRKAPKGGIFAEIGVYKGGSLKVIAETVPDELVVGFDTFEGLPESLWSEGEIHKPKDFSDTSFEEVQKFLSKNSNTSLVKGIFPDSAGVFEHSQFSFVHIDTDFYLAVKNSLEWVWPRLLVGGIVVFDDYEWGNCPGVKKALDEFGVPIRKAAAYQAYLVKDN